MRVLWIVGGVGLFPEAVKLLSGENTEIKATGGWISASAQMLTNDDDISLAVAMVSPLVNELKKLKGDRITYYILPQRNKGIWGEIYKSFNPHVVHIHGTENYSNIIQYLEDCGNENVIVSIQGILPAIVKYTHLGLSFKDKLFNLTIADLKRNNPLISSRKDKRSAQGAVEILNIVQNVIGRTTYDRAYVWAINPQVNYYFCNETLRKEFYEGQWKYNECEPYSIFLSQADRPLKGLHYLLRAMPLILREYPVAKIRVAGIDFVSRESFSKRLKMSGFGRFINKEIKRLSLSNKIVFTGSLSAEGMREEYLRANVFVNPSTIENSPNSLCEAQMLGVPCLSSFVGGVPDMMPNNNCGEMYRLEDTEELAYKICRLFETSKNYNNREVREIARQRHDATENIRRLKDIYKSIR